MILLKSIDSINRIFEKLAGVMLAGMVISITIQVFARIFSSKLDLSINVSWTEEVARYLMIWMVFVGGALAARKGRMIAIETVAQLVPAVAGKILKYISHLISIVFYLVIFYIGLQWVSFGGSETAPVTQIPMSILYSSMVVGSLLMTINTIGFLVEIVVQKKDIRFADIEEI
jgi:TRAP-type transport system small permease protein